MVGTKGSGRSMDLSRTRTMPPAGTDEKKARAEIVKLRQDIDELQELLYADRRRAVLIVLQGMDTSGKDGTIRSVFRDVGPLGTIVHSFGVPSEDEQAHDFLWRYHLQTPTKGHVVIFNRSQYEAVLVERVKKLVPPRIWKKRFDQINAFESTLAAEGTVVMKFFLHISKGEQGRRLQARIDNPKKHWKLRQNDFDDRKLWPDYQAAYADVLRKCNTAAAPWIVVPADRKWYRDVVVGRAVIEALKALPLSYPAAAIDLEGLSVH